MTTKLNRIKSALRECIEIASKATPGPWEHEPQQDSIWSGHDFDLQIAHTMSNPGAGMMWDADQRRKNATFIAHARTMTPLACKALLTAIEGLKQTLIGIGNTDNNMSYENSFIVNSIGDLVEKALSSITSEWPDV